MLNKLTKANAQQRTITVNMGYKNYVTLPIDNSNIKIDVNDDGVEQTVTIFAHNTLTNEQYKVKTKMTDVPVVFGSDFKVSGDNVNKDDKFQDESNAISFGNSANYFIGLSATIGETSGSTFRLMKSGSFSPKLYSSGWRGGSRAAIKTFHIAKVAKATGILTVAATTATDMIGIYNYYSYMNAPDHLKQDQYIVHPYKALLNLGIGVYSFYVNPLLGIVYFGIDTFYPGGWEAALNDQDRRTRKTQEILGSSWNPYKEFGGF